MRVFVRLLDGFLVEVADTTVRRNAFRGRAAAALVKLLALSPSHRMHREQVIDALWPDVPLARALPRLHKAAHFARKALGHPRAVMLRDEVVALFPEAVLATDVAEFEAAAARAEV